MFGRVDYSFLKAHRRSENHLQLVEAASNTDIARPQPVEKSCRKIVKGVDGAAKDLLWVAVFPDPLEGTATGL